MATDSIKINKPIYKRINYSDFNSEFSAHYEELKKERPLTFTLIELNLRLLLAGRKSTSDRCFETLINTYYSGWKSTFRKIRSSSLKKIAKRDRFICDLPRFKTIEDDLSRLFLGNLETSKNRYRPAFWNMTDNLLKGDEIRKFITEIRNGINKAILFELSKNCERELENNIDDFIRRGAPELFITDNAYSYLNGIAALAVKKAGGLVVQISHGYIQDPALITFAPLRADIEVVWSKEQKQMLDDAIIEHDDKIYSFGCPTKVKKRDANEYLFLIPYSGAVRELHLETELNAIIEIAQNLTTRGLCTAARFHPKDCKINHIDILRHSFSRISSEKLETALGSAKVVIGHQSSVLYQAASNGIPTIQVYRDNEHIFPGCTPVSARKLCYEFIEKIFEHKIPDNNFINNLFDSDKFFELINKKLMQPRYF